ncbi:pantothenate synthetase [Candidatus Photodesmus blepharus]|uniref:Pantothenate synthetase n=1 Tax=Candidatus Photodesmus blepharonis TaxID=1179155 RepID=A0A084CN49_9GAMM|nr:pantoate--beta-alanine ligase [Candidatus Photodesmus blepharus]KEY91228.1 pantothenate synthetase [Candidatus Photodesmus blepharus]
MQVFAAILALRNRIRQLKREDRKIALVPTMGNLHKGHLALIREAHKHADIVIVSIFVNPIQFESADDLSNYPRTLEDDLNKLSLEAVDLVFTPTAEAIYPEGLDARVFITVPEYIFEGVSRRIHFRGVATIVAKLFNIIQPDVACFGEKDFQQLVIIRKMVTDLSMDIDIVSVPIVREINGLAMSSRNHLLTQDEVQRAPELFRVTRWIASVIRKGRRDYISIIKDANIRLCAAGLQPDQIFIRDANMLQIVTSKSTQVVILMSVFLGKVRLIDNQVVKLLEIN